MTCYPHRTAIRHLISADLKEERSLWCSQINRAVANLRAWDIDAQEATSEGAALTKHFWMNYYLSESFFFLSHLYRAWFDGLLSFHLQRFICWMKLVLLDESFLCCLFLYRLCRVLNRSWNDLLISFLLNFNCNKFLFNPLFIFPFYSIFSDVANDENVSTHGNISNT